jgi:hypothetical protein|tara:strand:+ start:921 stop:1205 length:285 start_codon:yes stop_codon:yes gene_type:complete
MSAMELPETLSLEQINQLKKRLQSCESKKLMRKATLDKYHKSAKGKKARSEAQMRYYWKIKIKKQKKTQEELRKRIDKAQKEVQDMLQQLDQLS